MNKVAKTQNTALTTGSQKKGLGDHADQDELMIPRAKLLQSNSPEIVRDRDRKYSIGDIINSLTGEVLPEEFVPVFRFTNYVRWNPRNSNDPNYDPAYEPGAIIWRSDDPDDPKVQEECAWGEDGSRPKATKYINFFAYFPGVPMPVVISFSNTSFKSGKKLNSLCQFTPGSAIYDRKYRLFAKPEENDKGQYQILDVDPAGVTSPEEWKVADTWYESFHPKVKDLKLDEAAE